MLSRPFPHGRHERATPIAPSLVNCYNFAAVNNSTQSTDKKEMKPQPMATDPGLSPAFSKLFDHYQLGILRLESQNIKRETAIMSRIYLA